MHPVVALVTAGVEMDVLGLSYAEYSDAEREAVVHAHPRGAHFKEDIIQAFYDGIKHKPETTFGNCESRCPCGQGSALHSRQFLQGHPRIRLARVNGGENPGQHGGVKAGQ